MGTYEIVLAFTIGVLFLMLSGVLMRLSFKGISRLILNAMLGAILLLVLSAAGIDYIPVNPLNALCVGYLGVFGVALLAAVIYFL